MAVVKSWKAVIYFLLTLSVASIIYSGYFYCSGTGCSLRGGNAITPSFNSNYEAYFAGKYFQNKFFESELKKDHKINLEYEDVIVFVHIQKTGGRTFNKQLVKNLKASPPCKCHGTMSVAHCRCLNGKNQAWLFSRLTTGWACGVHADWTELTACVDRWFQQKYGNKKRKFHYITMLRDPVQRFVSEWLHVQLGATWITASLKCNGRRATVKEVPRCYHTPDWKGVTLKEFMDCPHNLAFNRQTRMLADLTVVNCYNTSAMSPTQRGALMLHSAKQNLQKMAFFGLTDFQTASQFLFEHTLHMNFLRDFVQSNRTHSSKKNITENDLRRIAELNYLDVELYQFAKDLFLQRVRQAYEEEGRPLSEQLELLIAQQAVRQEKEREEGNFTVSLEQNLGLSSQEDIGSKAAVQQKAYNVSRPQSKKTDR
ncbi:heparan-sulfate 6-O-sulfotransferase 2-like [Babylonia areolata]|uniref:heparan-sulfate 6-O-sulfotransferase 2-like n=1 Tax=Babylonia areolata TaxID=304850 RepID=UPI003FD1B588